MIIVSEINFLSSNFLFVLALKKATRFGAKPDFGSTFVNFQQNSGQPGFISEADRFGSTKGSGFTTLQKQGEKSIFQ